MEPAGLNSTAEPLTPTIHQCRGVTRQGQGYVTGGGRSDGRWRWGGKGLRALMGFGTWEGLVTEEDRERLVYCKRMQQTNRRRFPVKTEH